MSVDYQRGVFARTPIKATQTGDSLRVEIGPAQGSYPGMMKARGYELRLPADWPPVTVTVNGKPVERAVIGGKGGWSFEGNTLTTVIPVPSGSVAAKVTVDVRRAPGLTARRSELDGFAGAMTRLRGAYDSLRQTWPVFDPPDPLIDAMQSGDRLSYHPERAAEEIAHFHDMLPRTHAAVAEIGAGLDQGMADYARRMATSSLHPVDIEAEKRLCLGALSRAKREVTEAGK